MLPFDYCSGNASAAIDRHGQSHSYRLVKLPRPAVAAATSLSKSQSYAWPQRSHRFALGVEPNARWVVVAPDPESPSRWLLHGPAGLPSDVTVFELPDFQYGRQATISARLTKPWKIRAEDTALAATQMPLRTVAATATEFRALPGEAPWEPRQEEALRLALADHPVCAIKGPPGTGKSTVIVGLIRRAIHSGQRVLLVAPTHVALDEVLGRIHDLRQRNLERIIVPARVAPADERRVQVKPELEEYIAGNLGRNLARKAAEAHSCKTGGAASGRATSGDHAPLRDDGCATEESRGVPNRR